MWLQRHNYFAEQPVQWTVLLYDHVGSRYVDKDSASIEYYKCLDEAEKFSKEAEKSSVKKDEAAGNKACAAWYRGEANAWKILMDAGGGLSLRGYTLDPRSGLPGFQVHIVVPGEKTTAYDDPGDINGKPVRHNFQVWVQGKIIALASLTGPSLQAALTGRVALLSVEEAPAAPYRVEPTAPAMPDSGGPCPWCRGTGHVYDQHGRIMKMCPSCNGTGRWPPDFP
jgi:hypothetical protein